MNVSKIDKTSRKIPWLAGWFAAQVVLAVLLFNVQSREPAGLNEPLLALDSNAIDRIEVSASEGKLELQKIDGQWQVGEGSPVVANRVEDLLKQPEGLRRGCAVATSKEAAKRFEVGDDNAKREVRFFQHDKEVDKVLMGSSPAFRQVHVRKPGDSEIYSVRFDEYQLVTNTDSWLDLELLRPAGDITELKYGEHSVKKIAGQWPAGTPESVAAAAPVADLNDEAAAEAESADEAVPSFDSAAFAKALADLTVLGLADNQAELDAPVTEEAVQQDDNKVLNIQWEVTTSEGSYQYQLLSTNNDQYYIRRADKDHTFRLSKMQYDALAKIQELRQS